MKQKIVIRVCGICCDKCRSKAMALAAAMCGVDSVAIDGKYRDELVVVGDCLDSTKLASALRKKVVLRADILEVSEVKKDDKKPPPPPKQPDTEDKKKDGKNPPPQQLVTFVCHQQPPPRPPPQQQQPVTLVCHHCFHPVAYVYYPCYCYCHSH